MNKSFKILFSFLAIITLVMAGCTVGGFSPEIGGEDDFLTEVNTNTNAVTGANLAIGAITTYPAAGLEDEAGQVIRIPFTGVVDVSGGTIPGLTIYNLAGTAAATAVRARGAAIAYTAEVVQDGANSSYALITVNLAGSSAIIELVATAATLAGNGGTRMLDSDGDNTPGEVEDDLIQYFNVTDVVSATNTTATTAVTGRARTPGTVLGTAGVNFGALAIGGTTLTEAGGVQDSGLGALTPYSMTKAILDGAYSLELMTNGVFGAHAFTSTYDTGTGAYVMTVAAATRNQVYRVVLNSYNVYESAEIDGYVHRASYDQFDINGSNMVYGTPFVVGNPTSTFALGTDNNNGQPYVTITGGTYVDMATITADTVSVIAESQHNDGTTTWKEYSFTTERVDDNTIRLLLPASAEFAGGTDDYKVIIQPAVWDRGADRTSATQADDDQLFINTADQNGVQTLSGTF